MPSFECLGCGDVCKKSTLKNHRMRCRNAHSLTCIDCGTTFHGAEIDGHTACISEAQKYQGKLYQGPKKPAAKPQQQQQQQQKQQQLQQSTQSQQQRNDSKPDTVTSTSISTSSATTVAVTTAATTTAAATAVLKSKRPLDGEKDDGDSAKRAKSNGSTNNNDDDGDSVDLDKLFLDMHEYKFKKTLGKILTKHNGAMKRDALIDACVADFVEQFSPALAKVALSKINSSKLMSVDDDSNVTLLKK